MGAGETHIAPCGQVRSRNTSPKTSFTIAPPQGKSIISTREYQRTSHLHHLSPDESVTYINVSHKIANWRLRRSAQPTSIATPNTANVGQRAEGNESETVKFQKNLKQKLTKLASKDIQRDEGTRVRSMPSKLDKPRRMTYRLNGRRMSPPVVFPSLESSPRPETRPLYRRNDDSNKDATRTGELGARRRGSVSGEKTGMKGVAKPPAASWGLMLSEAEIVRQLKVGNAL